jgi:glycosyltransferase involved in cell wall biosynthesis
MAIKLSFCIPTFNFVAFIGATLRSIIDQADERVPIVVIGGGSTGNTVSALAEAAQPDPEEVAQEQQEAEGYKGKLTKHWPASLQHCF